MRRVLALLPLAVIVAVAALTLPARPAAAQRIVKIEVFENTKTTDDTVILVAGIEKGDRFSLELLDQVRRDLVSSGLFKDVEVFSSPEEGGVKITILARDKHSWVIAPTYYDQPTNRGGGVGFGENNLFGENKKLLLYGQIATGDSFFIGAYVDPSIRGTRFRWQYDVFLRRERNIEYAAPTAYVGDLEPVRLSKLNYLNTGIKGGMRLFRGAHFDARLRGAYVFYSGVGLAEGAVIEDVTGDPMSTEVPAPGAEGWDVSTELSLTYDRRANWYGITSGDRYRFTYEHALPGLGSDFQYWYAAGQFQRARKYFERHNLVLNATVGYGRNLPFQQEYTSGGTDLRGFRNRQLRGDFKASSSIEYSVPIITIKGLAVRGVTFWDSAYTAFLDLDETRPDRHYLPDAGALGLVPWKNSVGVGTRLYIRQIVLPLLGLDLGYGPERNAFEVYFAVGLTDF
jgi:outer membrane protein insertion porin family